MKIKKAFSLAEILIVMTVIGVIAMFTVPTMMKNARQAQYKTGVKKAFNTLSNFTAALASENKMPNPSGVYQLEYSKFLSNFIDKMPVIDISFEQGFESNGLGKVFEPKDSIYVTYEHNNEQKTFGTGTTGFVLFNDKKKFQQNTVSKSIWVTTNDNISYGFYYGRDCKSMAELSTKTTLDDLHNGSCLTIIVDVNSVFKLPNKVEPQDILTSKTKTIDNLTGDQYHIYIANDGVYPGSIDSTVVGKIVTDSL